MIVSALATLALVSLQQPSATGVARQDDAVRVFLDCQANGCDTDYLRTQITFINYVRFREDADVYVLVTGQQNGAGGSTATLFFLGQGGNAGRADTLTLASGATDTPDELRSGLARMLKLGLIRYVAGSRAASRIAITYTAPDSAAGTAQQPHDPWNAWVFRISANAYLNGESKSSNRFTYSFLSASRTTEAWRLSFSLNYDDSRDRFTYPVEFDSAGTPIRDTTVISTSHSNGADALVARSLGARWALGGTASYRVSTYSNLKSQFRAGPVLEFDVFPYAEFTRRRLVFNYSVTVARAQYAESTLYFKTEETLFNHALDVSLRYQQPWGSAGVSANWSQYLHDLSKNRLRFSANMNVRIVRGLALRLNGSYSRIRDQLSLAAGAGSDPTEVLLRRIQLATNYRYYASVGLSYTFGSKFNNVVNPRLDNNGGDDCCD